MGKNGITLIPQPSDDPLDPLKWSMAKKLKILAVISLATFSGFSACLAGQLQVVPQSELYNVSTNQIAYQNSAGSAGMAAGGFFFFPLSHLVGRSSAIFWSLVGTLLSQIWASLMTHPDNFNSFIVSRFFGGFFGSITGVLGPRILVDLFYLHQRGRAFTVFHWCFDFGTVAGPTLSAFIDAKTSWANAYKWTAGLVGFSLVMVFLFLHETSWNREPGSVNPSPPNSFIPNRIATFFPGIKVTPKASFGQAMRAAKTPFLIALSPVTLVLSVFTLVHFGFYVAMNSLSPVFLQKPIKAGGYGFTVEQNAEFSFAHWVGIVIALIYGQFLSDHLPLFLCRHFGHGIWKPEYRLHALWIPSLIFNPIGLGLFGAGLQYHLSWGVLALGQVFVTFGSLAITPITVNYINECFINTPAEASIAVNLYRVGFGLSVAFYIKQWVAKVDVGWAYGMMALFEVGAFGCVGLLMWKGHKIRTWTWTGLGASEEGERVVEDKHNSA